MDFSDLLGGLTGAAAAAGASGEDPAKAVQGVDQLIALSR